MKKKPPKKRVTVQEVATLWRAAYEAGMKDPRNQVVQRAGKAGDRTSRSAPSPGTSRAAKELGLIPRDWR